MVGQLTKSKHKCQPLITTISMIKCHNALQDTICMACSIDIQWGGLLESNFMERAITGLHKPMEKPACPNSL